MILTCPQCQSQYNLDPAMLGVSGRDVRCVSCSHMWFQIPDTVVPEPQPAKSFEAAAPAQETAAKSITDALNSILEKDDAAFDEVLSNVAKGTKAESVKPSASAPASALQQQSDAPEERKNRMVRQETALPVVTHDPMGMGASAFGGMVFLLCTFATLMVVFIAKGPIIQHWPQMVLLYKTLGFEAKAPGEGLRLSEITAERRIDNHSKTLVVEGKMTNITEHDIAYPALHIILKNEKDMVTKEWDLKAGVTQVASGDIVPVMLQLQDVPEDGSTVEVRVKEK